MIEQQLDQNTSPMPKVFFQPFRYAAIIGEPFGNDIFVVLLFFGIKSRCIIWISYSAYWNHPFSKSFFLPFLFSHLGPPHTRSSTMNIQEPFPSLESTFFRLLIKVFLHSQEKKNGKIVFPILFCNLCSYTDENLIATKQMCSIKKDQNRLFLLKNCRI